MAPRQGLGERMQYVVESSALATEVDECVVVLNVDNGSYFNMRDVSAEIWRKLTEPCTLDTLCSHLATIYAAPDAQIRADTERFVAELEHRKLIKRIG